MPVVEDDIDNSRLIEEVEGRPLLYNKTLKEYSDVNAKSKAWEEVCQQLFQVWGQLSAKEKTDAGKLVQKRWKNIRTCFSRELREQKQTKSGQAAKKDRRKYKYFDDLLFLVPSMETRETSGNISNATDRDDGSDDNDVSEEDITRKRPRIQNSTAEKPKCYEEKLLNILQEKKQANSSTPSTADKETHFALSLVPLLKQIPEDSQLDVQIEILQIFKKAQQKNKGLQTSSPINYNQPSTSGIKYQILPQKPKISDARCTIIQPRKASTSSQSLPSTSPETFLPIISTRMSLPATSPPVCLPATSPLMSLPTRSLQTFRPIISTRMSLPATSPPVCLPATSPLMSLPTRSLQTFRPIISTRMSLPATSPPVCLPETSRPMSLPTRSPQNADYVSMPPPTPSPNSNDSMDMTLQSYLSSFNDSDDSEIYDVCYK